MSGGYIVYSTADNSINSVMASAPGPMPGGLAVLATAFDPTSSAFTWNPAGPTAILTPVYTQISRLQFAQRFTAAEYMAIKASTDPNVQFFMEQLSLSDYVSPGDPTVQGGLSYLVGVGLLTSARSAVIGAP